MSGPPDRAQRVAAVKWRRAVSAAAWTCLAGVLALPAFAQPAATADAAAIARQSLTQYRIDTWQTEQGLPLNTVQSLYQGSSGHLWVGTAGGVARFDGVRFNTLEGTAIPELAGRSIFGFMEDSEGYLWIALPQGAVRGKDGKYERVFAQEVTDRRRVWGFVEQPRGVVWSATENGLVRWDRGKGVTKVYRRADGLPTDRLRAITAGKDGTLWIATTGGGLVSFAAEKFRVYGTVEGIPHAEVRHVLAKPDGSVWAATAGGGLAELRDDRVKVYRMADGLPTDHLTALAEGRDGELWIGTWGAGVVRFRDGRFATLATGNGLAGDQIWSLHADAEGGVWIGTWSGGLNRLRPRPFTLFGKPEGLAHDNVRSVLHARDGSTWVSMSGGGVNRIADGRIQALTLRDGLPTLEASALYEDNGGAIWIGTYTEGVARWRAGRIDRFGVRQGLPNVDVRTFFQDRDGTLWVGTRSGLARFDGRRFVPVREAGAPAEGVAVVHQDRNGTLWFGSTGSGLFRYRDGIFTALTRKEGLVSNWILSLHEDASGALWIGSAGEGMNRLKGGQVRAIRPADGLWDGVVQTLIPDRAGNLWITCNRGFFRVSHASLDAFADGRADKVQSVGFGPGDALRSTTFAGGLQPAGTRDAAGHLWLASFNGLVIVDPEHLPGTGAAPAVRLDEARVDGQRVPTDGEIVLPPGSRPLALRYFATSLNEAERVQFRYRMEGLSDQWVDAGGNREAAFAALPHGQYRFQVMASLDGRRWSEATAPLAIRVQPRFHQTSWFIGLLLLALALATLGAIRWRTRHLRLRQLELERLVAEKTEALRQANEHLSHLSMADPLTGLANRRRMESVLNDEWRRAARAHAPLAVLMADIDAFKAYNDSLGHLAGDRCLARVAEVLGQCANRPGDLVARYGGEEFIAVLPGLDAVAAAAVAERMRAACEALQMPHPASPAGAVVTISVGAAATVPAMDGRVESLIEAADAALYRAKQAGRNRCERADA
ncbi:MAG: diguanylate cyclase [Betaproteobacteria bacterium]|nr:diguanylate cyclase [Betaproteobacteria bacterium]